MIKAIETHWKGYRFRSRLEARWAVFFQYLGWRWEYEPQGFEKDGTRYLPDFLIHPTSNSSYWVEVKGDPKWLETNKEDIDCLHDFGGILPGFCNNGEDEHIPNGLILLGQVPEPYHGIWYLPIIGHRKGTNLYWRAITADNGFLNLNQVLSLHKGIDADLYNIGGLEGDELDFQPKVASTPYGYPHIYDALKSARGARFEHGEKPL